MQPGHIPLRSAATSFHETRRVSAFRRSVALVIGPRASPGALRLLGMSVFRIEDGLENGHMAIHEVDQLRRIGLVVSMLS